MRRAGRELRTGRLGDQFGADLPVSPTVELSSPANFRPSSLVGGVSEDGDGPNAYIWTRATQRWHRWTIRPFSSLRPCRRGLKGRGWPECLELDQGSVPVVSAVDLTGASKIMPTAELTPQVNFRRPSLAGGVSEGGNDTNAESSTGATDQSYRWKIR